MKVSLEELNDLMVKVLSSKHYTQEQAQRMADVFMFAQKSGKELFGFVKLLDSMGPQDAKPEHEPVIDKKSDAIFSIDGGGGAGPLIAALAMEQAIENVGKHGIVAISTTNTFSSTGMLGYYTYTIAKAGYVGIMMSRAPINQAHYGGVEAVYGTNPLSIAVPKDGGPIVVDMATSALTYSDLVKAYMTDTPLPKNAELTEEGVVTTNASDTIREDRSHSGALLPFGNHPKASGLAMMVELLAGVLTGSDYAVKKGKWGNLIIAIDPEKFIGRNEFEKRAADLAQKVKNGKSQTKHSIHIPGENIDKNIAKAESDGYIDVDADLFEKLKGFDDAVKS